MKQAKAMQIAEFKKKLRMEVEGGSGGAVKVIMKRATS